MSNIKKRLLAEFDNFTPKLLCTGCNNVLEGSAYEQYTEYDMCVHCHDHESEVKVTFGTKDFIAYCVDEVLNEILERLPREKDIPTVIRDISDARGRYWEVYADGVEQTLQEVKKLLKGMK